MRRRAWKRRRVKSEERIGLILENYTRIVIMLKSYKTRMSKTNIQQDEIYTGILNGEIINQLKTKNSSSRL